MELKTETWTIVRSQDLDVFIEHHLGRPWSVQQNAFYPNGSMRWYEVFPQPDATAKVEAWLATPPAKFPGRSGPSDDGWNEWVEIGTHTILAELCNRGLLPEGDLKVYVSW